MSTCGVKAFAHCSLIDALRGTVLTADVVSWENQIAAAKSLIAALSARAEAIAEGRGILAEVTSHPREAAGLARQGRTHALAPLCRAARG